MSLGVTQRPQVSSQITKWDLLAEHELRIQVDGDKAIRVKLLSGAAEMFGTEMAPNRPYYLSDCSMPVFSWKGCSVEIQGECHAYIANETPMNHYLNLHFLLQKQREDAHRIGGSGPRIMIVGGTDAGKSSLSATLCSWASRSGEEVTYVDLDLGQGSITIPGVIAATAIDKPVDIEESFNIYQTPIAFYYGDVSPGQNPKLYTAQMKQLSDTINRRFEKNKSASASGLIINTMGWVDGLGYSLLLDSVNIFNPDTVVVLGHERLYSDLENEFVRNGLAKRITLAKLPKSGGVVTRESATRRKGRFRRIKEYFYGRAGDLSPHSSVIPFKSIQIFKPTVANQIPDYALPIGVTSSFDPLRPREVLPSIDLMHSILAVSHSTDPNSLLSANIAGYVYVSEVSLERQTITVLQPCPGPLPSRFLIGGALKYLE